MKTLSNLIKHSQYIFLNNKLFIRNKQGMFVRINQKLPEFIDNIHELKKYDYEFSINKNDYEFRNKNDYEFRNKNDYEFSRNKNDGKKIDIPNYLLTHKTQINRIKEGYMK